MRWRAVVTALDGAELLRSRVSVYLHPFGGRPILWHVLRALHAVSPPPDSIEVLHEADDPLELEGVGREVRFTAVAPGRAAAAIRDAMAGPDLTVLVEGAAPLLTAGTVERLLEAAGPGGAMLPPRRAGDRRVAVAAPGERLATAVDPRLPPDTVVPVQIAPGDACELIVIRDRHALAEASVALRDRQVRQHEDAGVSFLLPDTTWLDVDVRIGADTLVYPGCVLEGATVIGSECVIGPHSRLVGAKVGRGVELEGWNYVCRVTVRNHAVLEAHERRGID